MIEDFIKQGMIKAQQLKEEAAKAGIKNLLQGEMTEKLIAEFCSEYSYGRSTLHLINMMDVFRTKDLSILSDNQMDNTLRFVNSLANLNFLIYRLNSDDYRDNELAEYEHNRTRVNAALRNRKARLTVDRQMTEGDNGAGECRSYRDLLALDNVAEGFEPDRVICNFFNRYALQESRELAGLLCHVLLDAEEDKAQVRELGRFQQDVDDLIVAGYFKFKQGR